MAKLYFYYSAMNAGKSTILLQSAFNYQERGMKVLLFTPHFDDHQTSQSKRLYEHGKIHSRIGLDQSAIPFDQYFDFYNYIRRYLKIACILVDEAQFLTKAQVLQLSNIVDRLNIPVLTYGLRTDYTGESFEGSLYLLSWADHLIEIKTICHCGRKASMNLRLNAKGKVITKGSQIKIGGNESYLSVCRKHFKEKNLGPIKND